MRGTLTGGVTGRSYDPGTSAFALRRRSNRFARACVAVVFFVLPAFVLLPPSRADAAVVHTIGTAYDLGSDKLLYSEAHCGAGDALEREVIYRDAKQRLIAHKTLDYRTGPATPSYVQRNYHAGDSIAVALREDTLEMAVGDLDGAGDTSSARPDGDKPLVIDAGFDAFVRGNWDALVAGETLSFDFPLAARASVHRLRVGSAACSYDTATDQCFQLQLDNWLLRAVLDPIELGYDAGLKRLARYRGLSNIGDGAGKGQVVDIRYRYEDLPAMACELDENRVVDTARIFDASPSAQRL